jgi:hypothetical protein
MQKQSLILLDRSILELQELRVIEDSYRAELDAMGPDSICMPWARLLMELEKLARQDTEVFGKSLVLPVYRYLVDKHEGQTAVPG